MEEEEEVVSCLHYFIFIVFWCARTIGISQRRKQRKRASSLLILFPLWPLEEGEKYTFGLFFSLPILLLYSSVGVESEEVEEDRSEERNENRDPSSRERN